MIDVKICGITRVEDALAAEEAGAAAIGFVFARSPRRISPDEAAAISARLGPGMVRVGVFADAVREEILSVAREAGLDVVQLHGSETPEFAEGLGLPVIKTFRADGPEVLDRIRGFGCARFLLDAPARPPDRAGSVTVDSAIAAAASRLGEMVLAGGLFGGNVAAMIEAARPAAVDASSGLESKPGKKDPILIRRFIEEVRRCECRMKGDISAPTGAGLFRRLSSRR